MTGMAAPADDVELHQPALLDRRADEAAEQRVRLERARLQLRVELNADEPRVALDLDDLGQEAVRRQAGDDHALVLEPVAIGHVDLVAVTVADRKSVV